MVVMHVVGEFPQEGAVQAVRDIQADAVNAELCDPGFHRLIQIVFYRRVLQIQFDEFVVAFPVSVGEAVFGPAVVEVDIEPVPVGAVPFLFNHILKEGETAADMIEYAVENNADSRLMEFVTDGFEILIRSEPAVQLCEVTGVIAVTVAFEDRIEQHAGDAEFLHVRYPVQHMQDTVFGLPVVFLRGAAESDRIDLINILIKVHSVPFRPGNTGSYLR